MPKVSSLRVGEKAVIGEINCEGALKERLISMGIARGERLEIMGKSASGATFEIMIAGCRVALRKNEANAIEAAR